MSYLFDFPNREAVFKQDAQVWEVVFRVGGTPVRWLSGKLLESNQEARVTEFTVILC